MNVAQTGLYWREWALARDWFRSHGKSSVQADEMRHSLHVRALGKSKSSKQLTNPDLDKVLAAFRAVHDGGNLDAQLRAEEMPAMRVQALIANVRELARSCVDREGKEDAYLSGMANKLFQVRNYKELPEGQLSQLRGILMVRIDQIRRAKARGKFAQAPAGPNPF